MAQDEDEPGEADPAVLRAQPATIGDFFLLMLAGLLGGVLAGAASVLAGGSEGVVLVVSSGGQVASQLAMVFYVVGRKQASMADIGVVVEPADGWYLLAGVLLQIGLSLATTPLLDLMGVEESPQALVELVAAVEGLPLRVALVLVTALLAPMAEEIAFRGVLQPALIRRLRPGLAVAISAVAFGLFHLLGIAPSAGPAAIALFVVELSLVGGLLGFLALRRGRLGPSIFTHAGFNLVAVLALFYAPELAT